MIAIKAEKRIMTGKSVQKLRRSGKIPAVLYGAGENVLLLEVVERDFEKVFRQAGESSLVDLEIGTEKKNVLIHDVAFDPLSNQPLHIDFLVVRMDKPIKTEIQLVFEGEAPAVKNLGGVFVKVMREIEVEALPRDLPHDIKIDISNLQNLEDHITVADLKLPAGVTVTQKPEEVIALVEAPRAEEEVATETVPSIENIEVVGKKVEEGEEGAESAEPPSKKTEDKK